MTLAWLVNSRLLRSGVIYAGANILSAGVPFLLLPLLTRALAPAEYGEIVSFYMLVAVTSAVAGLTLHAAVGVRWLDRAKGDPASYTATAIVMVAASATFAALGSALIAPRMGVELSPTLSGLAAIVAGTNVLQSVRFAVWQSCEQPRAAATLQVSSAILNITLSLLAVFVLHMGGFGRIAAAVLSGGLVAVTSIWLLVRDRAATRPTRKDAKDLLRFGVPLIPHTLAGSVLTNADRFAVSAQLGVGALGVYGVASQMGMVMNVMADAAMKAYTPTLYRLLGRNSMRGRLRVVAITYLSLLAWIVAALVAWVAFAAVSTLLLGDRYMKAVPLAMWFMLGGAATAVYINISALFFFQGKTEWISVATVSASAAAIVLANFMVSAWGVVGGAFAYLASQCVVLVIAWLLSAYVIRMPWGRPLLAARVLFRPQSRVAP